MGIALIIPDVDFSESNLGRVTLRSNYTEILKMYPQMEEYIMNEVAADDENVTITSSSFIKTLKNGFSATDFVLYLDVTLPNYQASEENRNIAGIQQVSTPRLQASSYGINLTNSIQLVSDGRNKTLKFMIIYKNGTLSCYVDGVKIDDYTGTTTVSNGYIALGDGTNSMPDAVINRIVVAKKA